MTETKIELRKLTAADGMILTNGTAYSEGVYLGCNDSADNWHEITKEEYNVILEKQNRVDSEVFDIE